MPYAGVASAKPLRNHLEVTNQERVFMPRIVDNGSARCFYSVAEVSQMFGISQKSVYRLLERGLLKSSSALRHKMISEASIQEFVVTTMNNGGVQ